MSIRTKPDKIAARQVAKVLRNPKSSKSAKSSAAKELIKHTPASRIVHSAPRVGIVSRSTVKRAVSTVLSSRKTSSKKR